MIYRVTGGRRERKENFLTENKLLSAVNREKNLTSDALFHRVFKTGEFYKSDVLTERMHDFYKPIRN